MDLKQQEYFVAIVEEGSISKAAKKLFISQPTLSQFLSKLEASLETKLVERSSNNTLSLTAPGQLFYETSKKILLIRDDFKTKFSEMTESASSNLVIGNNMGLSMSLLLEVVGSLSAQYPNAKVSFRHGKPYILQDMLSAGEVDMGFSSYREQNPKFEYIDFPPMEMVMVLHESHPLYHLASPDIRHGLPHMDLKCFENDTFVQLYQGTVMRDILDDYCLKHDIKLNISLETYGSDVALKAVEGGLGVSVYPPDSTRKTDKLHYIGLNPPLYQKWGFYYNKSAYQTAYFRDFIKAIKHLSEREEPFTSE